MWFVYVGVGLVLLIASGIYVRRRIGGALAHFDVRPRRIRIMRWVVAWLLFGFPLLMILSIAFTLAMGRDNLVRFDGPVSAWLFAVPFAWAMLVVFQSTPWLIVIDLAYLAKRRHRLATRVRSIAILAVVGAFAIYTPLRVIVERGDLRVRTHRVGSGTTPPFRIAFVADIQQDTHTDADAAREIYEIINARQSDIVLSGGDWINTGPEHIVEAALTAGMLKSRLGTHSVRGDHEHFAYLDRERSVAEVEAAMRKFNIAMIANEARWFEHHGKRIAVVFLNYNYIYRTNEETIARLVESVAHADYKIVVTHQLDAALTRMLEGKIDLILGAHTHGGQINPVLGVMHVELARLETDFIDGRYERGKTTIIITAGVGYSIIPIRYASPGSIEFIELAL